MPSDQSHHKHYLSLLFSSPITRGQVRVREGSENNPFNKLCWNATINRTLATSRLRGRHLIQFTYTSHSNTKEMVETRGFHLSRRVVNDERKDDVEMREGEER